VSPSPPFSVLSDGTIARLVREGRIRIDPWDEGLVQPASVDLRLGDSFRVFHNHKITAIDLREPPQELTEKVTPPPGEPFVIHPGEFCLGRTLEHVELPDDIVARIEGKSSLGRLGLIVHATAGFCDPGWKGTLTQPHARADQALPGPADRAAFVHDARLPGPATLRPQGPWEPLPGPGRCDRKPLRSGPG
jgi:deoxycytidine triphosphate deaminase